ncbi:hypothetical protein IEO21_05493 [Rhodonia placenta]|uniref:Uncharacterized protein n=1 Tax=Rhodonia placenta TaxID=104341 RepID=A0A8H7P203_9APHY|nr:hypothetical protein IEO21_05493 [Postia placenta]
MSDFIFVKSSRLAQVMQLLARAGFDLYSSDPSNFTAQSSDEAEEADDDLRTPAIPPRPAMTRSQSHSPSGCDVSVLAPDLTYVGLRDDSAETWGLKIVKLVAFPELITVDTVLTTDTVRPPAAGPRERSASVSSSASSCASIISPPPVPFFSFTRTAEGSSLTAPVELLAALFPPSERHMVICSDELDVLDSRAVSPTADPGAEEDEEDDDEGAREAQGPMRCLQIDLRKFGLGQCTPIKP